jgi:GT2 family glycosyltransferase
VSFLAPPAPDDLVPRDRPPTISVVISAYQAAGTVAAAVRSVLEQSVPPHELIVIDDGSTDDTADELRPFGDRVLYRRKENGGAASARNVALELCTGEYFAILDADDTYALGRIEAVGAAAAARPDLDLVSTDAAFVFDGRVAGTFLAGTPFAVEAQRSQIFWSCYTGGWAAILTDRLKEIGGFDESFRIAYDWDCVVRLMLSGSSAGMIEEPLYEYTMHGSSLSAQRVASLWERVRLLENATSHPSLTEPEAAELSRALRHHRTKATLVQADAAIRPRWHPTGLPQLVVRPRLPLRARLAAGLALTAPPLARRVVPVDVPPDQRG